MFWLWLFYLAYSALPTSVAYHVGLFKIEDKTHRLALAVAYGVIPWFLFVFLTAEVFGTWFPIVLGWELYTVGIIAAAMFVYDNGGRDKDEFLAKRRDKRAAEKVVSDVRDLYEKANFPPATTFASDFIENFKVECQRQRIQTPDDETLTTIHGVVSAIYKSAILPKPAKFDEKDFDSARLRAVYDGVEGSYDSDGDLKKLKADGKFTLDVSRFERRLRDPEATLRTVRAGLTSAFIAYAKILPSSGSGLRVRFSLLHNTNAVRAEMAAQFRGARPTVDLDASFFDPLFDRYIAIDLSPSIRFRHQWVLGLTGSGKTQFLQAQIAHDLEAVKRGEASIVVIDSKGMPPDKMLSKLAHLKDFAPGQRLDGKLVLLQPDMSPLGSAETMPPSLAIFDVGQHNTNLTGREREILEASALDMITSALTDASGPQKDLVEFLVQFCLAIPGATLETLGEILETPPKLFEQKFAVILAEKVDPTVSRYLRSAMGPSGHDLTRQALLRRVTAMVRHKTFRRMFEGTRNLFNMEEALDDGKVILINTDLALLKEDACQMFGRYFLSLLLQATFQRKSKKPVYCYIDECQDYLKNEERITLLIDKARDQKVALILAHHRMSQINNQNVMDALASSAIRFVSPNDKEASALSRYVRDENEILLHLREYHFAAFIDRVTPHAIPVAAKPDVIEDMPKMSDEEFAIICQRMRDLYCTPPSGSSPPSSTPPPASGWDDVV